MAQNPMLDQIYSLPQLLSDIFDEFDAASQKALDRSLCLGAERLYIVGCGDSHHAALGGEMAFESIAGLPTEAMRSMKFARYTAPDLRVSAPNEVLVIGISVSGRVARTIEAVRLGGLAGATTIALTGSSDTPIAQAAERVQQAAIPPFQFAPGVRSFAASLLGLYLNAIRIASVRGRIDEHRKADLRAELCALPEAIAATIEMCDPLCREIAQDWRDADEFVFCGSGPSYASALFSAAKILEASGDPALGQDVEEWAHLQYFARQVSTPTFLITAGGRDASRIQEVAVAAKQIGRRLVGVIPAGQESLVPDADVYLPAKGQVREPFWTIVGVIAGELFAAHRAAVIGEPHFRAFGGGRDVSEGGGISRIQSSQQWMDLAP